MFRFVCVTLIVMAVTSLTGPRPTAAEVVYIGISTPGLYELPTEIAQRKGFYKEAGFDARKVVIRTTLHVPALIAGELDYSTVSGIIGRATIQGLPVKGVMGWFDRPLHMLIARPEIKKLTDLKGRKVAVSGMGSAPHIVLREAFAQAGMNPDRDVTVLAVGGSGDRLNALTAGTVDATPVDVAYIEKAEKLGLVPLLYLGDVVQLRLGGFGVSNDKIRKNPNQIVRMIRSTLKGVRFMKNNKPETLAIMRDYLTVSAPAAEKIYELSLRSLNVDGFVAKSTLDAEIRLAKEQLKISEDIPEEKLMDWRFLKEVLAQK
ncbi:MAG TPA: ABC transporter substrate-binding protein [Candidatus Binatia bacterium]|jgi:ABC-type nitrate/sulfonate/bicarbonate transport system substrate-binding protein